jgi:predicted Zn-ribbon and HTH transcriptional regulator
MPKAWQKVRPNEAVARAIIATDWQPLSGMMKKRCSQCRYSFAETTSRCPDCAGLGTRSTRPVTPL